MEREKNINPDDLNLFHVVDEPDEVINIITEFYKEKGDIHPNLELE